MKKVPMGLVAATAALAILHGAVALAADDAPASQPTFYKDVLPILQENCQACHRPGGKNLGGMVAPMALVTYDETRPWAKSMVTKVKAREMPPWHAAAAQHGVFKGERTLTDAQIDTVVKWGTSGAPAGNPSDAPPAKVFKSVEGWAIGEPDLIVKLPQPFWVADEVVDVQPTLRTVISAEQLPEDRWIKAVEFHPGCKVVHHIIAPPLGGIAPGNEPMIFEDGYGQLLAKGSSVTWQMHYHKEAGPGTGVWDESSAGIKFYPKGETPKYAIQGNMLGNLLINIPPGAENFPITGTAVLPYDAKILSFMPHMHVRGKSSKITALLPDGKEELLLEVPKYDYNWQTRYAYVEPKILPKGTTIKITSLFDNSTNNPNNPDPTKPVRFGEKTTDEMMFGFLSYSPVNPADAPPPGARQGLGGLLQGGAGAGGAGAAGNAQGRELIQQAIQQFQSQAGQAGGEGRRGGEALRERLQGMRAARGGQAPAALPSEQP